MACDNSCSGFSYTKQSIGGIWKWSVSVSTNGGSNSFVVSDITSPFGKLCEICVPIPSDIVSCMNNSISEVMSYVTPIMAFSGGSEMSMSIVDGTQKSIQIGITNVGMPQSLLNATAVSSTSGIVIHNSISGLQRGSVAFINATIDWSISSGYHTISISDGINTLVYTVNVTIVSRPVLAVSTTSININYYSCTGASDTPATLSVMNTGPIGSIINSYSVCKTYCTGKWLNVQYDGSSIQSGSSSDIVLTINNSNIYYSRNEKLIISSDDGQVQYVDVNLIYH